jgi:hypothetical protein
MFNARKLWKHTAITHSYIMNNRHREVYLYLGKGETTEVHRTA